MEKNNMETAQKKLDLTEAKDVAKLGLEPQKNIAKLSDMMLTAVRVENMDNVIKKLKQTIEFLDSLCKVDEAPKKIFFAQTRKYELEMKESYRDAEKRIDVMAEELKAHQHNLLKNKGLLEQLEKLNRQYITDLEKSYSEGKSVLDEMDKWMQGLEKSWPIVDEEDTKDYLRVRGQRKHLGDRVQELAVSREISYQMSMQLRLLQENDMKMSDKIQEVLLNTVALWKNQIVILLEKGRGFAKEEKSLIDRNIELKEHFNEILKLGD